MTERHILFSGEMVRAILDGRKTVTRRPVKGPHAQDADAWHYDAARGLWESGIAADFGRCGHGEWVRCPYGVPGDHLWVRETHAIGIAHAPDDYPKIHYRADMAEHDHNGLGICPEPNGPSRHAGPWAPSIHMPRWASRLTLEVVSVTVERAQDATNNEAQAEGFPGERGTDAPDVEPWEQFRDYWQRLYGTWDANPWVWRVEFRRMTND